MLEWFFYRRLIHIIFRCEHELLHRNLPCVNAWCLRIERPRYQPVRKGAGIRPGIVLLHFLQPSGTDVLAVFEPGDVRTVGETPNADRTDGTIRHDAQRRIARVVAFLVGIVAGGVVAADHAPTRVIGLVLIRAMQ